MTTRRARFPVATVVLLAWTLACAGPQSQVSPRNALVIGIDVSGSFQRDYDDAVQFAAYYLYGHLNGLDELRAPSEVLRARRSLSRDNCQNPSRTQSRATAKLVMKRA